MMYKITLDTNVILAGYFWKGDSSEILLYLIPDSVEWAISPYIIDECKRVMTRQPFRLKLEKQGRTLDDIVQDIKTKSSLIVPTQVVPVVARDSTDDHIVACAYESLSDYLVSFDNDLLDIKQYKSIPIVSPATFLVAYRKTNI